MPYQFKRFCCKPFFRLILVALQRFWVVPKAFPLYFGINKGYTMHTCYFYFNIITLSVKKAAWSREGVAHIRSMGL
jgi:hypothetical protein